MVFMLKKSKIQYSYTNMLRISSLEETTIVTMLFFTFLQMSIQERILIALILVSEWTVAGK